MAALASAEAFETIRAAIKDGEPMVSVKIMNYDAQTDGWGVDQYSGPASGAPRSPYVGRANFADLTGGPGAQKTEFPFGSAATIDPRNCADLID